MATEAWDRLAERLRNWGRWGPEDERGTLNHIGPEALRRGAGAVRQGKLFALGLNYDSNGPQIGTFRSNPVKYVTDLFTPLAEGSDVQYCDDVIHMCLQASTQWDAFAHMHYGGQLYNGLDARSHVDARHGAHRCGIEHLALPGISSRGVLLDIARLKGMEMLPRTYVITPDDMNAACETAGVRIEKGDIILVRTGMIRLFTDTGDAHAFHGAQAGLGADVVEWLHDHDVAAVAADNMAVEALGIEPDPRYDVPLPVHMLALRDMGMPLGEIFNLEALAADCAADKQYDFLLSAPPLPVTGGFGSPVNPQAIK
ncbi:cyclase family protein [Rhizorhabdus sp.]|uniref:cyclase family protein n=1 Tax=Rhizorhabdus sp. TaxID=1968843 RepID=UPI001B7025D7|nr:cyclase family protein [Rhizorhabdus sp.]MBP8230668.1 cyclase family protein [Rhizorhabdus sp.]